MSFYSFNPFFELFESHIPFCSVTYLTTGHTVVENISLRIINSINSVINISLWPACSASYLRGLCPTIRTIAFGKLMKLVSCQRERKIFSVQSIFMLVPESVKCRTKIFSVSSVIRRATATCNFFSSNLVCSLIYGLAT